VWVESVPGRGSSFVARVPVEYSDVAAAAPQAEAAAHAALDGDWVLLVEDDEATRMIYEKFLRDTRFHAVAVSSLATARELLKSQRPVAVVLDIVLPGEEQQTWRWLAETKAADAPLPVIVATQSGDERKAYSLGADVFLDKPVTREKLLAALEKLTAAGTQQLGLIIDDDPAARYVIRRSVREMRFEEAKDGPAGLAAATRLRPEVIFLDMAMPGMRGDEVLERLKADPATRAIPVVVVTSHEIDDSLRSRLSGRARAILQKKDISIETLARALDGIRPAARP
jgi:CheY-like chemotaxis protein